MRFNSIRLKKVLADVLFVGALFLFGANVLLISDVDTASAGGGQCVKSGLRCPNDNCTDECPDKPVDNECPC